jgi:hypothetical protein
MQTVAWHFLCEGSPQSSLRQPFDGNVPMLTLYSSFSYAFSFLSHSWFVRTYPSTLLRSWLACSVCMNVGTMCARHVQGGTRHADMCLLAQLLLPLFLPAFLACGRALPLLHRGLRNVCAHRHIVGILGLEGVHSLEEAGHEHCVVRYVASPDSTCLQHASAAPCCEGLH